ncbi:hypothetical protein QBC39DRAFT_385809 [Podospora conica]|nr:hypothetical protein QBC39DRAFT_385809 [Schizothecium conicum]
MKLSIIAVAAAHLLYSVSATPVAQSTTLTGENNIGTDDAPRNYCCNPGCGVCPIGNYCTTDTGCTNPLFQVCCNYEFLNEHPPKWIIT